MLTPSLITLIKKSATNWTTESIRELLNEVHRICLTTKPVGQMRVFDTSTGNDYLFTTTNNQFQYEITTTNGFPENAWRVTNIYTSKDDPKGSSIDFINTDATQDEPCKILFKENPGLSEYYFEYFKKPREITSASIQLNVPPQYHIDVVKEGVLGLIELSDNGRSERWDRFMTFLVPKLIYNLNEGSKMVGYYVDSTKGGF